MSETKVDLSGWESTTKSAETYVSSIFDMTPLEFNNSDLTPFVNFNDYITLLNSSLSSLRTFTSTDVVNMNRAAQNKVADDHTEASNIQSSRGKK